MLLVEGGGEGGVRVEIVVVGGVGEGGGGEGEEVGVVGVGGVEVVVVVVEVVFSNCLRLRSRNSTAPCLHIHLFALKSRVATCFLLVYFLLQMRNMFFVLEDFKFPLQDALFGWSIQTIILQHL